jgi:hypothetical protein
MGEVRCRERGGSPREEGDPERALVDALTEHVHARPQPVTLEMDEPAQPHPTHK